MANVEFGINTPSIRKMRLYYYGTNVIYEGMPLCYEFDSTTNVLGYSKSEGGEDARQQTTRTTTAEGYQNEGKFMRVTDPAASNLMWFAGVVCQGGYVGTSGPKWIDVYEPNGAIVPVRSGLSTTTGLTVFAIRPALQYFTHPLYIASATSDRAVALAEETATGTSGTPVLCLAKLVPTLFLNQGHGATSYQLLVGVGATTGTMQPNFISLKSTQTGGELIGVRVRAEAAGAGMNISRGALMGEAVINAATATGSFTNECDACGVFAALTFKTGNTPTATEMAALFAKVENQDATPATLTSVNLAAICACLQDKGAATTLSYFHLRNDGTNACDYLIRTESAISIGGVASISNPPALATGDIMIPIRIGGTTYYIPAMQDSGQ